MDRIRLDGAGRRLMRAVAIMATAQAASQAAGQLVLYVDDDAQAGGDGSSWQTAYVDLQDALDRVEHSAGTTEIRIAGGVYYPDQMTGNQSRAFHTGFTTSAVTLTIRGGFAGIGAIGDPDRRDVRAYETILSGDLNGDDGPGFTNRADNSNLILSIRSSRNRTNVIDGITFRGAQGSSSSGAVTISSDRTVFMIRCKIIDNQGTLYSGLRCTSGIELVNCVIINNRATESGGRTVSASFVVSRGTSVSSNVGSGIVSSEITVYHSTISMNSGVGLTGNSGVLVARSIVWGNGDELSLAQQITVGPGAELDAGNSIIMGWDDPNIWGVFDADPRFVDPLGADGLPRTGDEDLRLLGNSPAINQVAIATLNRDEFDLDDDGDFDEPVPFDLVGNARVVGPFADIGAYEFQICPADLTATSDPADPRYGIPDGMVTIDDFFVFLDLFSAGDPRADLTGSFNPSSPAFNIPDGRFDATDFFAYLTAFELGCL